MHPVILRIGPFSIYSYGVMVALGFGLATALIYKNAARYGIDKSKIIDFAILILFAGIVGARVFYVLSNIDYYIANPFEILNLSKGGLVWYGGFASALLASIWYLKKNSIPFWTFADFIAPYIALAQGLGRIGCFLNGCCFGMEASRPGYPFAVIFPDSHTLRHPTQVHSSLALLFIFIVLRIRQERPHFTGQIFLAYCILYSMKRYILEYLRGDNPILTLGLTVSQVISILVFSISIPLFLYKAFEWKRALLRSK
ncbi:MAG: prolipoprotein diacylglyceryl transferase [Candidatus Omnitrophica bacterium]|nr:prolipoprotein diacylglyceryl transferase [Candidatus Omnitrophota bacterium]